MSGTKELKMAIDPVVARALVGAGWSPALVGAHNVLRAALQKATSTQIDAGDADDWEPAPLEGRFPLWSEVEAQAHTATALRERYTRLAQAAADLGGRLAQINTLLDLDPCTYGYLAHEALTIQDFLVDAMREAREARRVYEEARERADAAEAQWEEAYDNLRRTPDLISQLWAYWEESTEAPNA